MVVAVLLREKLFHGPDIILCPFVRDCRIICGCGCGGCVVVTSGAGVGDSEAVGPDLLAGDQEDGEKWDHRRLQGSLCWASRLEPGI